MIGSENVALQIIFFFILFIVFYVYFGYPVLLAIINMFIKKPLEHVSYFPSVTLFIPAHNEEGVIGEKIENSLNLTYPNDKLEIVVASDLSTDKTVAIAKSFLNKRIRVFESTERGGKNSLINNFIGKTSGEIIVFTDANSFYQPDAVDKLVRHFADDKVGLVVGKLKYIDEKTSVGKGEGMYFRYESMIKNLQSKMGKVVAATGSIYAMRRELFSALDLDVANDFAHPIQVASSGYRIVFEPAAVAYEKATSGLSEEFKRRTRIVTRGITAFSRYFRTHRMLSGMWGFCFISHKLLRWFTPLFLILALVINAFLLDSIAFKWIFFIQIFFYLLALEGISLRGTKFGKILAVPFYFCLINAAALVGIIKYFTGKRQAVWETAKSTR